MPTTWPSFFSYSLTDHRLGRPFLWPSTPSYTQRMWTHRPSRSLLLWLITARQSAMRPCPSVMPAPSGRRLDGDHARVSAHVKLYLPLHLTHDAWRPLLAPLNAWVWLPMYNGLALLIWTTSVHCGLVLPKKKNQQRTQQRTTAKHNKNRTQHNTTPNNTAQKPNPTQAQHKTHHRPQHHTTRRTTKHNKGHHNQPGGGGGTTSKHPTSERKTRAKHLRGGGRQHDTAPIRGSTGKSNAANTTPPGTRTTTSNNTTAGGMGREHRTPGRKRTAAPAEAQSQQQHTPTRPTTKDTTATQQAN